MEMNDTYQTCDNCINRLENKDKGCATMSDIPDTLFCWANKEMQLKREVACLDYAYKIKAIDAIRQSKSRINALERR